MPKRHDPFFDGGSEGRPSLYLAADADAPAPNKADDWRDEAVASVGDPLLQALVWLTEHHGRARSADSLRAGMPLGPGAIAPDQALRIMREAGYNASITRKKISEVSPLLLPAVLLLNGGDACVLVSKGDGGAC
ncbi:MAG TPA: hypothetical protein VGE47_02275, partial [Burkholderiaceae bacterium]